MLRINDTAPNYTAQTTHGTVSFHEWIVIISGSVSGEDTKTLFPGGRKTVKPDLRVVAQPN